MNTSTDINTGNPSPPFRMMAPSGAPMKKNMMHDSASVIFATHSILCILISLSPSVVIIALKLRSDIFDCAFCTAMLVADRCWSSDSLAKVESTSYLSVAASFIARSESVFDTIGRAYAMRLSSL